MEGGVLEFVSEDWLCALFLVEKQLKKMPKYLQDIVGGAVGPYFVVSGKKKFFFDNPLFGLVQLREKYCHSFFS